MIIFYGILLWILVMAFGYLMGSIPFAIIISKSCKHMDIRDYGSHNAGGTNVGRVMGKKYGAIVIILDILKTAIAIWSVILLLRFTSLGNYCLFKSQEFYYYPLAFFITVGHCFPIFADFRGGKAVSTYYGTLISFSPLFALLSITVFFIVLKLKKYVSLSSMIGSGAGAIFTLLCLLPNYGHYMLLPLVSPSIFFFITALASSLFLIWRHKENIIRLKNHQEGKIKWLK